MNNKNRLIDKPSKKFTFKNWVIQHNPKKKWSFDNPQKLVQELCDTVSESGDLDLKTIFYLFPILENGLNITQSDKFLNDIY